MKNPFAIGHKLFYTKAVEEADKASFETGEVHAVYSTFALGRDAEWSCRLFVLEMKEQDEEGIGTYLTIKHHSPALIGQQVEFIASLKAVNGNEIIASFEAKIGDRLIASGETGQKIIKKERLEKLFNSLHD